MAKRITALILFLVLVLSVSGCAPMFEAEYLSITEYRSEPSDAGSGTSIEVKSYYELKNAITRLVNSHSEHGELEFKNYDGGTSDGSISADIAKACWEVQSETAYGAFAVDYMSHEISHIVSYYMADIYISYKHSKTVMDSIGSVSGQVGIMDILEDALAVSQGKALMKITSATVKTETVSEYVYDLYYSNPLLSPVKPEVSVSAYPESGFQRIFEVSLDYGFSAGDMNTMRQALLQELNALVDGITAETQYDMAFEACRIISELCAYNGQDEVPVSLPERNSLAGTAYGALLEKSANGEGFAMAYKAVCDALGIECQVVLGRLDKAPHAWNIIKLGESYYHVDVSQCAELGMAEVFLTDDSRMWGRYWWDTEGYPACEEAYTDLNTENENLNMKAPVSVPGEGDAAPEDELEGEIGS